MKPQDEFGSSFETAKELPETSWKRKAIQAASSQAEPIRKSGGFQGSALPTPVELREKLEAFLLSLGVSDVGFSKPEAEGLEKTPYAVTLVVRLSNAIVDEIEGEPTLTYFSHYRAVNAFLDQCLLKAGLFLDRAGYQYITVAASQSMNQKGWNYQGRFSHKQAACAAGLGVIGKSSLFLHHRFGPRVRLATLFTDCPFPVENALPASLCGSCRKMCGFLSQRRDSRPGMGPWYASEVAFRSGKMQPAYEAPVPAYWPRGCMRHMHEGLSPL